MSISYPARVAFLAQHGNGTCPAAQRCPPGQGQDPLLPSAPRCPFSTRMSQWAPAAGQQLLLDLCSPQTSHLGLAGLTPTTPASDSPKGRFKLHIWLEGFVGTRALRLLVCSSPCRSVWFSADSRFLFCRYCSEDMIFFA